MKNDNNGADNNNVFKGRHSISNISGNVAELNIEFSIDKFPKEFKKDHFKSFDYRFLIILFFSFLINVVAVIYFEKNVPSAIDSKSISKIQKQFAHLLLESDQQADVSQKGNLLSDFNLDKQIIVGMTEWVENFNLDIFKSLDDLPSFEDPSISANESRIPKSYSKEELDILRKINADKRLSARNELEREVETVGLLGLISGKRESNKNYEYIQDLMEYASKNSEQLTSILSKLNAIERPRYGAKGYLKKFNENSGSEKFANLKGERKNADNEINNLVKNLEPIKKARTETIVRNVHYEDVKSSYLSKLPQSEAKRKRSSHDVIRVVRTHMKTLQDCYKQELKADSNLKGKIIVRFMINPDGVVTSASVVSSTLNNPRMENCIIARVKRWKNFPPCDSSFGNMTYRQKFSFGI